jgi:hypothetical protein
MPGDRATWGVFLLVTFLCTSKEKLPARPQGEWKPCTSQPKIKVDSRLRGNDVKEKNRRREKKHHPHPTLPLKGRAKAASDRLIACHSKEEGC